MTSSHTNVTATLTLSLRDAQWVAAVLSVTPTILSTAVSGEVVAHNLNALVQLFNEHYSASEGNALVARARALLPSDTEISFIDGPFMVPASPMIQ